MAKKKVFLDTNFLMIPAQFKVDIFSEIERIMETPYELCVFDRTFDELTKLEKEGGKLKKEVKLTRSLLKSKDLNIIPLPSTCDTVDEGLLSLPNSIVATQDGELKRALAAKHTKVITLRQKKYLILVN